MPSATDNIANQRRFQGVERAYGRQALENFQNAHICIIGLGGVGSWTAEALARSAIGQLTLIDLDNVAISNINRQIHALDDTIGLPKIEAMRQRIKLINPSCKVSCIEEFLTIENMTNFISSEFNFIIDCIDDFRAKAALAAHCRHNKLKLILIGGAGGQTSPQHIKSADLSRTEHDPLLAQVRRCLRQQYDFPRNLKRRFELPCIFSHEHPVYPAENGELTNEKAHSTSTTGLNCAQGVGSAVTVTASFGLFAASHVLNKLAQS